MVNELKKLIVKEAVSKYQNRKNYLIVGYQGIDAIQFGQLRADLRRKKIFLEVVKNSLARIAFREMGFNELADLIKGPSAIVTGEEDPVVMAKETIEWSKKVPFISIRGGFIEGAKLSEDEVNNLAKLQPLPVIRSQIAASINAPIVGVLNAFNSILLSMANILYAIKEQKESSDK